MAELYHTIYIYKDLDPDLLIALYLLKEQGGERYPGIHQARVEVAGELPQNKNGKILEDEGSISFGLESALFQKLSNLSFSRQIVNTLKIETGSAIEAFLHIAEHTQQKEHQDFHMILESLIDEYADNPSKAYKASYPILNAHFNALQEELAPIATEYMNKLNNSEVIAFVAPQKGADIRVLLIESGNPEMAPFLHNQEEIHADVVVQKFESGHVNITTRQKLNINLEETIAVLRIEEARKKKLPFDQINWNDLRIEDRMEGLEEWKYDVEGKGIFNTKALGKKNKGATMLTLKDLHIALQIGLNSNKLDRKCPPVGCRGKKCPFYFYNLKRCSDRRLNKDIDQKKEDLKDTVQVLKDDSIVKLDL